MTAIGYPVTSAGAVPRAPRLRLTRRGRVVLGSLAVGPLVALVLALGIGATGAVATQEAGPADGFEYVTVDAGQTLWHLAADVAPGADPREFAAHVTALNNLGSSVLQPGQELAIPQQYSR